MKIRLLVIDIDGTLTDGGIYIGNHGEVCKRFNVKDGYAIAHLLPKHGIKPVVLTGRKSRIVDTRCNELGIKIVVQGCQNKLEALKQIASKEACPLENIAYIGDDLNDFECMKSCGVRGCPADACREIVDIADFVSRKSGGQGAVREFIEWLIRSGECIK